MVSLLYLVSLNLASSSNDCFHYVGPIVSNAVTVNKDRPRLEGKADTDAS